MERSLAGKAFPLHAPGPCRWRWPAPAGRRGLTGPCGAPAPRLSTPLDAGSQGSFPGLVGSSIPRVTQGWKTDRNRGPGKEGRGLPFHGGICTPISDCHCCLKHGSTLREDRAGDPQPEQCQLPAAPQHGGPCSPPQGPPHPAGTDRHPDMAGFGVLFRVPEVQAPCFSSHASHPHLPLGQVGSVWGSPAPFTAAPFAQRVTSGTGTVLALTALTALSFPVWP